MSDIAARIRERLNDLGISEREAERRAELGEGYIRNIKRGRARGHIDSKFQALAHRGLDCSVVWLRTGKGEKSRTGDQAYEERLRTVLETFDALDEEQQQAVENVMRSYLRKDRAAG